MERHARAAARIVVLTTDADLLLVVMKKMRMTWRNPKRDLKKRKMRRDPDPKTVKSQRKVKSAKRVKSLKKAKSTKKDLDTKRMRSLKRMMVNLLKEERNVLKREKDVLKTLNPLKKIPRKTALRMASKNLPRRKKNPLRMSHPTINPRDPLPRRLPNRRKMSRLIGTSTDPREKRKDPRKKRVKRSLSVTKSRQKITRNLPSVKINLLLAKKAKLLVKMKGNSFDRLYNDILAFIKKDMNPMILKWCYLFFKLKIDSVNLFIYVSFVYFF
jgi:hypothetical protein